MLASFTRPPSSVRPGIEAMCMCIIHSKHYPHMHTQLGSLGKDEKRTRAQTLSEGGYQEHFSSALIS